MENKEQIPSAKSKNIVAMITKIWRSQIMQMTVQTDFSSLKVSELASLSLKGQTHILIELLVAKHIKITQGSYASEYEPKFLELSRLDLSLKFNRMITEMKQVWGDMSADHVKANINSYIIKLIIVTNQTNLLELVEDIDPSNFEEHLYFAIHKDCPKMLKALTDRMFQVLDLSVAYTLFQRCVKLLLMNNSHQCVTALSDFVEKVNIFSITIQTKPIAFMAARLNNYAFLNQLIAISPRVLFSRHKDETLVHYGLKKQSLETWKLFYYARTPENKKILEALLTPNLTPAALGGIPASSSLHSTVKDFESEFVVVEIFTQ